MSCDLVEASNRNLRTGGRAFTDHAPEGVIRHFGPVIAGTTGVPVPSFNRVVVTEPPPPEDLVAAVVWIAERDVPFWVTATDSTVKAVESMDSDVDLVLADESPGMALASLADVPSPESVATITPVTDESELADFITVFTDSFGIPSKIARQVMPSSVLTDEAMRAFVGRVDDEPVASGLLFRSDDVAGVYNIGVIEPQRRRGIGEAMTRAVLRAGREAGCRIGVLQSSEMAVPLYRQMGFETVVTYHHFEPAAQVGPGANET